MTRRQWIQTRSRNANFLWRMVIGILLIGVVVGIAADAAFDPWMKAQPAGAAELPDPDPMPASDSIDGMAREGRWAEVWWAIPGHMLSSWQIVGVTALALLTGLCWLAFALQAMQVAGPRDSRVIAALLAVALGVLSIWPTLFLIYWQKYEWGLSESTELAAGVRDNVLGVGLREELSKFVCFLPLLPWCVRRRDQLAALVLAGCVGIGFGMEENIGYIYQSAGTSTLGRLLVTVPFHMAMTGIIGLAAYRACVWPREWAPMLVATFGVVFLAHGFYDALISVEALQDYAIATMVIFVLLIRQFFTELRPLRERGVEPLSLTANFLFCVSTVTAATFAYLCGAAGLEHACDAVMVGILGQAVMAYLFLREMPESMVQV